MLQHNITNFLEYCNNSDFSKRSIETLAFRLNEFNRFIQSLSIFTISQINYQQLVQFIADYGQPSPSVKKARVWSLHQFFHYLKLQQLIQKNIALELPYPKIEKKIAQRWFNLLQGCGARNVGNKRKLMRCSDFRIHTKPLHSSLNQCYLKCVVGSVCLYKFSSFSIVLYYILFKYSDSSSMISNGAAYF